MTVYAGNRYDGWNEYITYGGIPLVVLAETEEQKMAFLDNLFKEAYISDIVKRNKIRNIGEMEALLDVLSSSIGAMTNPNKLQKTFKSVNKSKITATTITKYIEYLEDAFLIEEASRYDIKGKVVDCDEHFIKLQLNEKEYLIAISKVDFIEYAL